MNSTCDEQAIATTELYCYLEQQVNAFAPEIPALVPAPIKVERVGFTRNQSNTPYLVYRVGGRRCCTFIARRAFLELIQMLLKVRHSIDVKIAGVVSSPDFGCSVKFKVGDETGERYIPSTYINKFFERYNQVALERIAPQDNCDCCDLYEMCVHQVAQMLQPRLFCCSRPF